MSDALAAMTELQSALGGLLRSVTEPPERSDAADRPARTVHRINLSDQPEAGQTAESDEPDSDEPDSDPVAESGPREADQPEAGEAAESRSPEAGEAADPAGGS